MPPATARILVLALPLALFGTSCASHLRWATAIRHTKDGRQALASNRLVAAHESYRRALSNVEMADLGPTVRPVARYYLARATGALCQHQEAERLLKLSLEELDSLEDTEETSRYRCKLLVTLGNLAYDRGLYTDAASYYGRAIPAADRLDAEEQEPMRYAAILDRYAEALGHAGPTSAAAAAATARRAADMRRANPGTTTSGGRLRFDGFNNAKEQILADLRRAETGEGPESSTVTVRLLWLGVLESNRGDHEAALAFFERGFRSPQDLQETDNDGESLAIAMDRYAHVLRAKGHDEEAQAIEARARALRSRRERSPTTR